MAAARPRGRRESFEMKCCRINVLLVVMELGLGIVITALGFYMQTLTPSLKARELPYWAGIPLLVAGVVGIYYCATDFEAYSASPKAFVVKCVCFTLSFACIFVCGVASTFAGIHSHRIARYAICEKSEESLQCLCKIDNRREARIYIYESLESCDEIFSNIKDYIILQCALNAIAAGVCLWFVTFLWKSRYQEFYSGLRFYSYSASVPDHP